MFSNPIPHHWYDSILTSASWCKSCHVILQCLVWIIAQMRKRTNDRYASWSHVASLQTSNMMCHSCNHNDMWWFVIIYLICGVEDDDKVIVLLVNHYWQLVAVHSRRVDTYLGLICSARPTTSRTCSNIWFDHYRLLEFINMLLVHK